MPLARITFDVGGSVARTLEVPFAGATIRVLDPVDMATFKVLFDRTKDWLDLTMMAENGTLDRDGVAAQLRELVGDDPRIDRLFTIG